MVIVIPDIVKGGNQPTSHRKVAIRACLDELYAAGVEQKDVLLLFSNGLHPRATVAEMQTILGPELFGEFYPTGQITSHDSEDYDHLVDLGYTAQGDHVIMNKYVYDAGRGGASSGYPGQPLRRLLRRLQALRHRHQPLAQHLGPPCATGDAPAGLRARIHPQRDAPQVRPAGYADGREDGQEVLLLRRGAGHQKPADRDQLRLGEGDAARIAGRSSGQAHLRPLGGKKYDVHRVRHADQLPLRRLAWAPIPSR
ncbi:MAG: lactate racemase domain-containing protein [Flavonifractor plautii]